MSPSSHGSASPALWSGLILALALSLAAAVSLGITRFAYALLLPPMRADLGWSYLLAGAMNTANAVGYLMGALSVPALMRRFGPAAVLQTGMVLAALLMLAAGWLRLDWALLGQRVLAGVVSAWVFVAGGLLAARLGTRWRAQAGLLLGVYYGGVGSGIVLSALVVPAALGAAGERPQGWSSAWWALGGLCGLATLAAWRAVRTVETIDASALAVSPPREPTSLGMAERAAHVPPAASATGGPLAAPPWRAFAPALLAYALFGVGYIGYMTFVIALLRERGAAANDITFFYTALGLAVMASSRLWARLLDRHRDGQPLARLNALLALATALPAFVQVWPVVLASGVLFGGVFLSVVASTTAWVRHNLPPSQWASGISAFTIVFAVGQIVGPTMVGWIGDGPGGLERGLAWSAAALALGAAVALRQRALA
ncbi:YbfB/YjiJ family MFS transporter [Tepidimonas charontis]|uniref:D-galactonate transporter n=1 Tax=Tepidimonas charontis TaxID=2267262 RepID=A0A554XEV0_9BURK|nr:YbfB/YjiJ family MFS transporter [Tepidimonas charontis]TSE34294.1 D-galactonate transporter [Tepidimonas charontis]